MAAWKTTDKNAPFSKFSICRGIAQTARDRTWRVGRKASILCFVAEKWEVLHWSAATSSHADILLWILKCLCTCLSASRALIRPTMASLNSTDAEDMALSRAVAKASWILDAVGDVSIGIAKFRSWTHDKSRPGVGVGGEISQEPEQAGNSNCSARCFADQTSQEHISESAARSNPRDLDAACYNLKEKQGQPAVILPHEIKLEPFSRSWWHWKDSPTPPFPSQPTPRVGSLSKATMRGQWNIKW